jgi:hypothetical protein
MADSDSDWGTDWDLEIIMGTTRTTDTTITGVMILSITVAGIRHFASTLTWATDGAIITMAGTITTITTMGGTVITIIMVTIITGLRIIRGMIITAMVITPTGLLLRLTLTEEVRETIPDHQTIQIIMGTEE